jgi:hypothetical protein
MSDYEKDKERQRQLDLMKVAVGNDDFDDEDDDDEGLSARGRSKTGPVRDEAMESARRFLWDEDDQEMEIPLEGGNINISGAEALYSSQNFGIDQGVNFMERPKPQSSRGGGFMGSVFRGRGMRDAASSESEEYISTRRRRSTGRMTTLIMMLMVAVAAGFFFLTIALFNKDVETASSPIAPAEPEEAPIIGSIIPEEPEEEEPVNPGEPEEEPASGGSGEPEEEPTSQLTDEERLEVLKISLPGGDAFGDERSPQKYALEWLAKDDPMKVSVGDEFMLERYVLAVLFFSTTLNDGGVVDPTWNHNENWMTGAGYCSWYGVECLGDEGYLFEGNGEIFSLNLTSNRLGGFIPTELGLLSTVNTLDLTDNKLFGQIPTEFGELSNARLISLYKNECRGPIPSELGKLGELRDLNLGKNNLSERIPGSLAQAANLRALGVEDNGITGPLPDFSRLQFLRE